MTKKAVHIVRERNDIELTTECGRTAKKTEHGYVHPWHSAKYECVVEVYHTTSVKRATCCRCIRDYKRRTEANSKDQLGLQPSDSPAN